MDDMAEKYLEWKCADCGKKFYCLDTDPDTACVNCGSENTKTVSPPTGEGKRG